MKQNYVTMTKLKMTMDFDYLNYVTTTNVTIIDRETNR